MKKTLVTLALVGATAAAFAQGKVSLQTDAGAPIMLSGTAGSYLDADAGVAGQAISTAGALPSGTILRIGLYAGTSANSLALVGSEAINDGSSSALPAGAISIDHIILPTGFPGGTSAFFQVKVWESQYASYEAQVAAIGQGGYLGSDSVFSMTPGGSISYPAINSGGGTTWGTVGNEAPLVVSVAVPEPATLALAGLGAAGLLIFRRRK